MIPVFSCLAIFIDRFKLLSVGFRGKIEDCYLERETKSRGRREGSARSGYARGVSVWYS